MFGQVERQGVRSGVDYRSGVKSIDNSRLTVSYQNQVESSPSFTCNWGKNKNLSFENLFPPDAKYVWCIGGRGRSNSWAQIFKMGEKCFFFLKHPPCFVIFYVFFSFDNYNLGNAKQSFGWSDETAFWHGIIENRFKVRDSFSNCLISRFL